MLLCFHPEVRVIGQTSSTDHIYYLFFSLFKSAELELMEILLMYSTFPLDLPQKVNNMRSVI